MTTNPNTAILVFSRFAQEEAKEKKFNKYLGKKSAVALASGLITHTLKEATSTGLPVYKFFSDRQQGSYFGEKLANSLEAVFEDGFSNVIIVGTDCPCLNEEILNETNKKLQQNELVLGPANDGGVYLIGIKNTAYNRLKFLALPWLSAAVFPCLIQYARLLKLRYAVEAAEDDIDHYDHIVEWTKKKCFHSIQALYQYLLTCYNKRKLGYLIIKTLTPFRLTIDPLRGPPLLTIIH